MSHDGVLARALSVLQAVASGDGAVSRAAIAERTGLPKATSNRIVGQLVAQRMLQPTRGGVRLGMRLFELGNLAEQRGLGLRDAATPYLADLYEVLRETVQLAVLDGFDVVYLQKISGRTSTKIDTRVGGRMPATCTGSGKVLLAFADPEFRQQLIVERGLPARTARSITDPDVLNAELQLVRQRKYAVDKEEFQIGTTSVAAPIFHDSVVVAAATISIQADRLAVQAVVPTLLATTAAISRELLDGKPGTSSWNLVRVDPFGRNELR
ncbi:IclR family transcriptional regulator [Pseudonocardia sp. TRM90224]|uniref:IclR family transcriptional regulator n=1 Tax=Pseudonocardia sp. TRM90224 TaxID=2812678 RepID=UPI001E46BEE9|nr:IclR family transcriptional regulator [Pseudonocardia sp. TRM90224]